MKVVISQPMYFPWLGIFEQIKSADIFIHYDDVQFPLGRSFISRVQIKYPSGQFWLTVPIKRNGIQLINEIKVDDSQDWRKKHLKTLESFYSDCPYFDDMITIASKVLDNKTERLAELNIMSIELCSAYFGLTPKFNISSTMPNVYHSSEKLCYLTKAVGANIYITGHGAKNYLNYEIFENQQIRVEYLDYLRLEYDQKFSPFNPHVSILDVIANRGRSGVELMKSPTKYWKDFINESNR